VADPKKVRAEANALVQELLARLDASDVRELEVTRGAIRVRVAKDAPVRAAVPVATTKPAAQAPNGPTVVSAEPEAKTADAIVAPLTGIFYRSPSPQTPAFVQIGSKVAAGDVIGLIEAMKLFNEIRSTLSGTVRRIVADNGQLVRARQPLIELDLS
jgi:acetyl-CoA carboxylase biotin carboxyl carrier protein